MLVSETYGSNQNPGGASHPVVIERTITVVENTVYNIGISIMLTDMLSSYEEVDIEFTHSGSTKLSLGKCTGGNSCDGCCSWYDCMTVSDLGQHQITSSTTSIVVKFTYSSQVSSTYATCTDSLSGKSGGGVVRVILTPVGKKYMPKALYLRGKETELILDIMTCT